MIHSNGLLRRLATVCYQLQSTQPIFSLIFLHSNRLVLEGLPYLFLYWGYVLFFIKWQYCDFLVHPQKNTNEWNDYWNSFYTRSNHLRALGACLFSLVSSSRQYWKYRVLWLVEELSSLGLFWENLFIYIHFLFFLFFVNQFGYWWSRLVRQSL